jgi:hypothetical protein
MLAAARSRLWAGLAAVAAIALLAVGPRLYRRGLAPEQQPAPEPEETRELVAKRYEAALRSPHRLEWAPEEIIPSNVVFDLCDDVQAQEAGLFSSALNDAREAFGVDCRTSERRFAYIPPNESMRTASSYEEAVADLTELAEKGSIKGERFTKPVGVLMGHYGSWATDLDPCGPGFGCARASIDVSRGTTRGMFANVSDQVAHSVTIRAGTVVAHYPLSVQPGENTAFELPAELSAVELATLSITATFVGSADPRRAVRLLGAPGDITGPRDELAKRYLGIDLSRDPPTITYFLEAVMLENSTTHPGVTQTLPGQVLDSPTAVVALLDENRKVIHVLRPPVTFDKDGRSPVPVTTMAFGESHAIGFVMPPEVAQYSISIGGAE